MVKMLKTIRQQKALSQRELAKAAGVALATINRIEQRLIDPHPSTRRKIADALGVKPEEIQW